MLDAFGWGWPVGDPSKQGMVSPLGSSSGVAKRPIPRERTLGDVIHPGTTPRLTDFPNAGTPGFAKAPAMTTLNPQDGHMVLINTFTVEPDKADALLAELSDATEKRIKGMPGFISANLHVSSDRKHVANYAQWRSRSDYEAFINDPQTREHLKSSADLAISFDPIIYELRETTGAGDS